MPAYKTSSIPIKTTSTKEPTATPDIFTAPPCHAVILWDVRLVIDGGNKKHVKTVQIIDIFIIPINNLLYFCDINKATPYFLVGYRATYEWLFFFLLYGEK